MNEQKMRVQVALADLKTACHPAMIPWVVELQKELDLELVQLRQRVAEANDYAERCTEANRMAELDNDELRAKLALAEQENVQLRVAISEATGLLRGFIKIAEKRDAAIASQKEST